MGLFLSMSGIVGKTSDEVRASLENYAKSFGGGLDKANLNINDKGACVIAEANGNVSILYPRDYFEWDSSSAFISNELKAPVFSFHIHDGDLWMYVLYANGEIVDQFNPVPDYWDENLSDEEINSWKGNAEELAKHIPYLNPKQIENYLFRWKFEEIGTLKAYPNDEFANTDWQLLDFMDKLRLPYPVNAKGEASGQFYKLLASPQPTSAGKQKVQNEEKPWWKFW